MLLSRGEMAPLTQKVTSNLNGWSQAGGGVLQYLTFVLRGNMFMTDGAIDQSGQVLQTNGCFYHSPLPSVLLEFLHNSRASSLHGHSPASLLLLAPPPPSRRPPFSRCRRLYSFLLRGFSPRDEEGFSSCLMRLCHRAAAIAPPERLAASVSLQRSVLPSLPNSEFGPWI